MKYLSPTVVAIVMLFEPVLAAFIGYAVGVNAVPTWVTLIGMACITCGAGVISAHAGAT